MKEEFMNEELITPKKASQLLCVSLSSLRNWEKEGKLRCIRTCGGHRRYRLDDIKKLLEQKS
jgi:putative resolvase